MRNVLGCVEWIALGDLKNHTDILYNIISYIGHQNGF